MQRVVLYQVESELYSLDFIEEQELPTLVVCPNPQLADLLSLALGARSDLRCITISKFISDKLALGFPNVNIFRKADFVMHLGTVFKKYLPESSAETFFQAFNLFTELRSYSLDFQLVSEVFPYFDHQLAKAVEIFWRYCDHIDLVDEHRAYNLLAEAYRMMEHPLHQDCHYRIPGQNIIFWGFSHLSAGQVDLVKAIGIYNDVYLPFSQNVFQQSKMSDWIRWIDPALKVEKEAESKKIESISICLFPKNRLAETLKNWRHTVEVNPDYFLGVNRPDFSQLAEVPLLEADYRASSNIFDEPFFMIADLFEQQVAIQNTQGPLIEWINEKIKESIVAHEFRTLKVWQLFQEQLIQWFELSQENRTLSLFDLSLLRHVVQLNLPRVFSRPLAKSEHIPTVCGLEGVATYHADSPTCICVTSSYSSLRNGQEKYCPEVMQLLTTLGPIRRGDFDYAILKQQILHILSGKQSVLFLEHGVSERDLAWAEILESAEDIKLVHLPTISFKRQDDLLVQKLVSSIPLKNRSATRLQSYIDCPRKYYFDYLAGIEIVDCSRDELSAANLGEIEHKAIELYMKHNRHYEEVKLLAVIDQLLAESSIASETIASMNLAQYRQEIYHCAKNAVQFLSHLYQLHPAAKMEFEFELPRAMGAKGKVDCVVRFDNKIMIFDFKRSGGGIPSQKEIFDFVKIQLWFYFHHLELTADQIPLFGYFNLSSPDDSLLFALNSIDQDFYTQASLLENGKIVVFKDDFQSKLNDYICFENQIVGKLESDTQFNSNPRSDSICLFCTVSNICPRLSYGQKS